MSNIFEADSAFIKGKASQAPSYFVIKKQVSLEVWLSDLTTGSTFKFDAKVLEDLVDSGILVKTIYASLPKEVRLSKIGRKAKTIREESDDRERRPIINCPTGNLIDRSASAKIADEKRKSELLLENKKQSVIERKMAYVEHVNQANLPGLSERHLAPEIQKVARAINDDKPPSWTTVIRWIKRYVQSGWDSAALYKDGQKGNKTLRMPVEVVEAIKEVETELTKDSRLRIKDACHIVLNKIEEINIERQDKKLAPLEPPTYQAVKQRLLKSGSLS